MEMHDGKAAILYKLEMTENNIPEVTETIVIDQELHVKLYKRSIPIPLPQWFRKGSDCKVKHKSVIENFPNYIKNYGDVDVPDSRNIPSDIMAQKIPPTLSNTLHMTVKSIFSTTLSIF